jgi:hypothetical protein
MVTIDTTFVYLAQIKLMAKKLGMHAWQLWPSSKEHPHLKGFSYMGLGAKVRVLLIDSCFIILYFSSCCTSL